MVVSESAPLETPSTLSYTSSTSSSTESQHVGPEAAYIPASVAFCPYHEQERGPIPATGTKRLRIAHILQNPFSLLSNVEIEILQFLRYQSCLASSLNPLLFLSLMTLLSFLVALILS
jgi:hypothetical protein